MFTITAGQLDIWIASFLWPLSRVLGLFSSAPIFGEHAVPTTVKIGLAALLTLMISPLLAPMPAVPVGSMLGISILVKEIVIGLTLSLMLQAIFSAIRTAGELAGLQIGLGFAMFFDPTTSGSSIVLSRILNMVSLLLFLAFNGHLMMLQALVDSFTILPVSGEWPHAKGWQSLAYTGSHLFMIGLTLSLPIIAAMLMVNLALGMLNRAAPQLNLFSVGFPLTLGLGLGVMGLALPAMTPILEQVFYRAIGLMGQASQWLK
jgi:flagellar biosynthesis protein FliR